MRVENYRRMVRNLNSLLKDIMNIADAADRRAEDEGIIYLEGLGMGYRALTSHLREGAKAIIDMQEELTMAREEAEIAETAKQECIYFLKDVFGDAEPDCFNEDERQKLRDLVAEIKKEWAEEEDE